MSEFKANVILVVATIVTTLGSGIVVYQILFWLKDDVWYEYSLRYVYNWIDPNYLDSWLYNPRSWFRLHKIIYWFLDFVPLSLCLLYIGLRSLIPPYKNAHPFDINDEKDEN